MGRGYLIRISKRSERVRAIGALDGCKDPQHIFPGNKWLITNEHLEALKRAGISFEDLTDLPSEDGKKATRKRSKLWDRSARKP